MDFITRIKFSDIIKFIKNKKRLLCGFSAAEMILTNYDIPNMPVEFSSIIPKKDAQSLIDRIDGLTFTTIKKKTYIRYGRKVISVIYHIQDNLDKILENDSIVINDFHIISPLWQIPILLGYTDTTNMEKDSVCKFYEFANTLSNVVEYDIEYEQNETEIQSLLTTHFDEIKAFVIQNDILCFGNLAQNIIEYPQPFPFFLFLSQVPATQAEMFANMLSNSNITYESNKFSYGEKYIYRVYNTKTNKDVAFFIKCEDNYCDQYMIVEDNLKIANIQAISIFLCELYFTLRKFIEKHEVVNYIKFLISAECDIE